MLTPALSEQANSDVAALASQEKINSFAEAESRDLQRFRTASQRLESLEIYNLQLQKLIDSQVQEIESIVRQTEEIESIETGALPLMIKMTSTLGEIIDLDVPWTAERAARPVFPHLSIAPTLLRGKNSDALWRPIWSR